MTSQLLINYLTTETISTSAGATMATFVDQNRGEVNKWVQYVSGGTALLLSSVGGITCPGATLVTLASTPYTMATTGLIDLKGPAKFYFAAGGTTSTISVIRGYNSVGECVNNSYDA